MIFKYILNVFRMNIEIESRKKHEVHKDDVMVHKRTSGSANTGPARDRSWSNGTEIGYLSFR